MLLKDDYSNYRHVYLLKEKSEVVKCFKKFLIRVRKETDREINNLRSDNGLEFVNNETKRIIFEHGTKHQETVLYTPEQTGTTERDNRTIGETARTLIYSDNFPLDLLTKAVHTAVYVLNKTGLSP